LDVCFKEGAGTKRAGRAAKNLAANEKGKKADKE
jgi:hypothetical protein